MTLDDSDLKQHMHQVKLSNPKNQNMKKIEREGPSEEGFKDFSMPTRKKRDVAMYFQI